MSKNFEKGRSMIEMLGVLAIIAVLSVGGIAGYSKAMEKFKYNKVINEYTYLLFGLQEHLDEIKKSPVGSGFVNLADSLNLLPANWKKINAHYALDGMNHLVELKLNPTYNAGTPSFMFEVYLDEGTNYNSYHESPANLRFCRELFNNWAYPQHSSIYALQLWIQKNSSITSFWYGDKFCDSSSKCLKNITQSDIDSSCKACAYYSKGGACSLLLFF